jgi:hypothetical protein
MPITVHPRIAAKRPDITEEDVLDAFTSALTVRPRVTDPVQWLGVGLDRKGRLLEFVAIEQPPGEWLIYYAMPATKIVLRDLELGGR